MKVDIREVCLRDGLQIEAPVPLSAKIDILEAIAFVSPSKVPALAAAARVAQEAVGHELPSALLRAGDRIPG